MYFTVLLIDCSDRTFWIDANIFGLWFNNSWLFRIKTKHYGYYLKIKSEQIMIMFCWKNTIQNRTFFGRLVGNISWGTWEIFFGQRFNHSKFCQYSESVEFLEYLNVIGGSRSRATYLPIYDKIVHILQSTSRYLSILNPDNSI